MFFRRILIQFISVQREFNLNYRVKILKNKKNLCIRKKNSETKQELQKMSTMVISHLH